MPRDVAAHRHERGTGERGRDEPDGAAARRAGGWPGFAVASFALFVLLAGSNLVTPLFPVYARAYGLSPLGVSLLFATYAFLVIPALLIFGPLSDVKGR